MKATLPKSQDEFYTVENELFDKTPILKQNVKTVEEPLIIETRN